MYPTIVEIIRLMADPFIQTKNFGYVLFARPAASCGKKFSGHQNCGSWAKPSSSTSRQRRRESCLSDGH
jgi:hypothetical protein